MINKIHVEVPVGSINVRDSFGENAVLLHSTGEPVLVNEWGFTLEWLQQVLRGISDAQANFDTAIF